MRLKGVEIQRKKNRNFTHLLNNFSIVLNNVSNCRFGHLNTHIFVIKFIIKVLFSRGAFLCFFKAYILTVRLRQ